MPTPGTPRHAPTSRGPDGPRPRDARPARRRPSRASLALAALGALLLAATLPAGASASTAGSMDASILSWINHDRAAHGLRPFRLDPRLTAVATYRAGVMASDLTLSHTVAGDLGRTLAARGIQYWVVSEDIGYTTATWGAQAAASLYGMWKASAPHWAILMSTRDNYVGVGVALSASGVTYGSVVVTESADHTRPVARMTGASRSGTTVTWTWTGHDPLLQTHTAGLRDFDVEYRVGLGPWRLVRDNTTARHLTLARRAHGHSYAVRVRDRDWRGNVGAWSAPIRIWVP